MKDLEQEYRKQVQEEMPELWNRIEPNLAPKKKAPWIRRYMPIASVAAAALVLLAVMPGLINLQRMGADNMSAADCVPHAQKTEEYVQEAAVENGTDEGETGASGAGAVTEGAAAEKMNDVASVQGAAEELTDVAKAEFETEYVEDAKEAEDTEMTETVTVTAVAEADGRTVYTLTNGEKFTCLAVTGENVLPLEKGRTYLVTLREENAEQWHCVVERAEAISAE